MVDKRNKVDPFSIVGRTGLRQFSGYVAEEYVQKLKGRKLRALLREMADTDDTVGGINFFLNGLISGLDWRVEPADESDEAARIAEFFTTCMEDMSHSWSDFIDEVCTMFTFGFAPMEIVYKRRGGQSSDPTQKSRFDDGLIGWRKLELRAQDTIERWEFDEDGGVKGMYQEAVGFGTGTNIVEVFIEINKLLLFRTTKAKNNPEGRSIFKNAIKSYCYKKRLEEFEAIGIERSAVGFPVFEGPVDIFESVEDPDSTEGAAEQARRTNLIDTMNQIAKGIKLDSMMGVAIPGEYDCNGDRTGFKLRLLDGGKIDFKAIHESIDRKDKGIAKSSMMTMIFLGTGSVGSRSMHESATKAFTNSIKRFVNTIEDVLNRFAVPRLMTLNGMDLELAPKFMASELSKEDLGKIGAFIKDLTAAGVDLSDEKTSRHLRAVGGLPDVEEQEFTDGLPGSDEQGLEDELVS